MKKLSELMREGAINTFQAFDDFFDWDERPLIGCCALGAVLYALGEVRADSHEHIDAVILAATDVNVSEYRVDYPLQNEASMTLYDTITSLNDDAKWTREQIADWLESLGM